MRRFHDWWQEWVADNPFVRRELRRWGRRGYAWKMPLWLSLLPAVTVSGIQTLYATAPDWLLSILPAQPGTLMLSATLVLHFILVVGFAGSLLTLHQEAVAERLDFIRALPMDHRELLLKAGIARSVLSMVAVLAGLPSYLIALGYGGIDPLDVATCFVLLTAVVMGPPSVLDITMARSARRVAENPGATRVALDPMVLFRVMAFQVLFQVFFVFARRRQSHLFAVLSRVWPPGAAQMWRLFPFALLPAALRFLWEPRPFYHLSLSPLLFVAAWWIASKATQLTLAAEMWAREPVVEDLPRGRTLITFPEETGREEERRRARRLGLLSGSLFFLGLVGFLWEPMVEPGRLGILVGSATPAGSVAALFLLTGALRLYGGIYRIRWQCLTGFRPAKETPDEMGLLVARPVLTAAGLAAAACLLGAVWPWPDLPLAFAGLTLAAAGGLVFAAGWRTALGPEPQRTGPGGQIVAAFGELFVIVAPALVLFLGPTAAYWHLAAAVSPLYAVLSLFSGLWVMPPLPLPLAAAVPATIGGMLFLASRRGLPREEERPADRVRRDAVDTRLERLAERWDNAVFSLEVQRQLRKPTGFALRLAFAVMAALVVSAIFPTLVAFTSPNRWGLPPLQYLKQTGTAGMARGAFLSLMGSGILLLLTAFMTPMNLTRVVRSEYVTAHSQRRLPFLLMSGLSDRDIVLGVLAAQLLTAFPALVAAVSISLLWLLLGLPFSLPWWATAAWAWAMLLTVTLSLFLALHTFRSWGGFDWVGLVTSILPMTPMLFIFAERWLRQSGIGEWIVGHYLWVAGGIGLAPVALLLLLPHALRSAIRSIHRCRTRRDVDIPSTAPGA